MASKSADAKTDFPLAFVGCIRAQPASIFLPFAQWKRSYFGTEALCAIVKLMIKLVG